MLEIGNITASFNIHNINQNFRNLKTKLQFFRNCVVNLNINLQLVSEIRLNNTMNDVELGLVYCNTHWVNGISKSSNKDDGILFASEKIKIISY